MATIETAAAGETGATLRRVVSARRTAGRSHREGTTAQRLAAERRTARAPAHRIPTAGSHDDPSCTYPTTWEESP